MRCIFIGGVGRSGTTATKRCFLNHPNVYGTTGEFRFMHPGEEPELNPADYSWSYLMHVYQNTALKRREAVWVEDSPENVCVFDQLITKFPDAVCIHAMRHPLATLGSVRVHAGGGSYWPVALENQALRIRSVYEHFERAQSPRVVASRLEDLVVNPVPFLRRVCDLVELDYDTRMSRTLDSRKINRWRETSFTSQELNVVLPILQSIIDRWYPVNSMADVV